MSDCLKVIIHTNTLFNWSTLDILNADILVSSSIYQRTFQSAIAFLSTFLYTLPNLKELSLIASNNTYFCLDNECKCPKYLQLYASSDSDRAEEFLKTTSKKLYNRIHVLSEIAGMTNVEHPLKFQDVMLGRYICRRGTLPCNAAGECYTVNDFVETADEVWAIAKRLFDSSSKASRSRNIIETWSLLRHLTNATRTARVHAQGRKIIKILSGHDVTLEPLMNTLSIQHRNPPHYASRLVFEVSRHLMTISTIF